MAKIVPSNLNVPYCKYCQAPMPVYAFTWDDSGSFHGICFCEQCHALQWRVLNVEQIMAEVIAAGSQKGAVEPPEEAGAQRRGMDNGYI